MTTHEGLQFPFDTFPTGLPKVNTLAMKRVASDIGRRLHLTTHQSGIPPLDVQALSTQDVQDKQVKVEREVPEGFRIDRIETFDLPDLMAIMDNSYGSTDWKRRSSDKEYWRGSWQSRFDANYQEGMFEKNAPESAKVTKERLRTILEWSADPDTRGHLDPSPGVPIYNEEGELEGTRVPDWDNQREVDYATAELARYYHNYGSPSKITPLAGVNKDGGLLGVVTIRRQDDENAPRGKVASIERLISHPNSRDAKRAGIGSTMMATAIWLAFNDKTFSNHTAPASEVVAWTMDDEQARGFERNHLFMRKMGFNQRYGESDWQRMAEKKGIITDRHATYWQIYPFDFVRAVQKAAKDERPITMCGKITIRK